MIVISEWNGIPGLIVAAPQIQAYDVAFAAKIIEEAHRVRIQIEDREVSTAWARRQARIWWEANRPFWAQAF